MKRTDLLELIRCLKVARERSIDEAARMREMGAREAAADHLRETRRINKAIQTGEKLAIALEKLLR